MENQLVKTIRNLSVKHVANLDRIRPDLENPTWETKKALLDELNWFRSQLVELLKLAKEEEDEVIRTVVPNLEAFIKSTDESAEKIKEHL